MLKKDSSLWKKKKTGRENKTKNDFYGLSETYPAWMKILVTL